VYSGGSGFDTLLDRQRILCMAIASREAILVVLDYICRVDLQLTTNDLICPC
jgi:hypothetical protein